MLFNYALILIQYREVYFYCIYILKSSSQKLLILFTFILQFGIFIQNKYKEAVKHQRQTLSNSKPINRKMSRPFMPTYHGSNDYKKYRQERLNTNNSNMNSSNKTNNLNKNMLNNDHYTNKAIINNQGQQTKRRQQYDSKSINSVLDRLNLNKYQKDTFKSNPLRGSFSLNASAEKQHLHTFGAGGKDKYEVNNQLAYENNTKYQDSSKFYQSTNKCQIYNLQEEYPSRRDFQFKQPKLRQGQTISQRENTFQFMSRPTTTLNIDKSADKFLPSRNRQPFTACNTKRQNQYNLKSNPLKKQSQLSTSRRYLPTTDNFIARNPSKILSKTNQSKQQQENNFQDQVILRSIRNTYGGGRSKNVYSSLYQQQPPFNNKNIQSSTPAIRAYNYTNKLNKHSLDQNNQTNKSIGRLLQGEQRNISGHNQQKLSSKNVDYQQLLNDKSQQRSFSKRFQSLVDGNLYKKQGESRSYKSRNQIVSKILNAISQNNSHQASSINNGYQQTQRSSMNSYSYDRQYKNNKDSYATSSNYKTAQITPQKPYTPRDRDEKNASQQRRKSLIQKSQMLKQKLNRMNVSSTKRDNNQQNQCTSNVAKPYQFSIQNVQQKQQTYTPKKFNQINGNNAGSSFNELSYEKSSSRAVSKRLNFNDQNKQTTLRSSKFNKQNCSSTSNQRQSQPLNTSSKLNQTIPRNFSNTNVNNQDPLKKISELNQKINDRLQSILKNYG